MNKLSTKELSLFKRGLDLLDISNDEFQKMNIVQLIQKFTRAKAGLDTQELMEINACFQVLNKVKKEKLSVDVQMEDDEWNKVAIQKNFKKLVTDRNKILQLTVPLPDMKPDMNLILDLFKLFPGLADAPMTNRDDHWLVAPVGLKKGESLMGVTDQGYIYRVNLV